MPNSTLFPIDREPLKPSADRLEPVVWLRRIVLLSRLDSGAMIREIPFRKGLNIIHTRQMQAQGGGVAGHSVGKTLLMRMIRYTLGEASFGTEDTQLRLSSRKGLESAIVVAHWVVGGKDWIVIRPLRGSDSESSFAVPGDDWARSISSDQKIPHREFVQAVNNATLSSLPEFKLSRGRVAKWLDMLAWLSRDYQCGYRKANEWRHEDSQSGPSLDREENSLVMQWVMGQMKSEEIEFRLNHDKLLKDRADHKRVGDSKQAMLDTLWPPLCEKLELPLDTQVAEDQAVIGRASPEDTVRKGIQSLERLKKDRISASAVNALRAARAEAMKNLGDADAAIREQTFKIQFLKRQITEFEEDPTRPYSRCQADPCWIKERANQTASDPARDQHLEDFHSQVHDAGEQLELNRRVKMEAEKEVEDVSRQLNTEEQRLSEELSGIDQSIGRWRSLESDARNIQVLSNTVGMAKRLIKNADDDIRESLAKLDTLRAATRHLLDQISGIYEQILAKIFGANASGAIQVDGNGLRPVPDKSLAPAGAALSVMTTVLAFDIACLAASFCGLGHHPRLLMHDSPREGDMEGPLFRRLFEVIHELEQLFPSSNDVSFQYIVTTTSEPPSHLIEPGSPYIVLTLDATQDEGRLMKLQF